MKQPSLAELTALATKHGFDKPKMVAVIVSASLRVEALAEELAEGDDRRKRDLLLVLGPVAASVKVPA